MTIGYTIKLIDRSKTNTLKKDYIFKSERLGFRNWAKNDLTEFAKINADLDVMKHFPKPLTEKETSEFIQRLQTHFEKNRFNYFATEILETGELIGFIGLAYQDYETKYTPAVDIGWRIKKDVWGKGYATEGANRCLNFAFVDLKLERIISICPEKNTRSENIMKKIGMAKIGRFKHPKLKEYPDLENCICYEINKNLWQQRF